MVQAVTVTAIVLSFFPQGFFSVRAENEMHGSSLAVSREKVEYYRYEVIEEVYMPIESKRDY
jgi:predicted YcjX-like family ATPase